MRLTALLLRKKMPNGHIWRGKDRLVWPVDALAAANLRHDYEREEENMFYLRHPYLTLEQSQGHAKELKKKEQWMANAKLKSVKFRDHVTLKERLGHLRVSEAWE
ncbi:large ribosomal subunit protein mL63 [Anabrus simplex]|uniref:large ribosomal subunit protein mL63 n=1 Tax=Anabrus simplex TaxID=316456 RepID=UPI0034DDBB60